MTDKITKTGMAYIAKQITELPIDIPKNVPVHEVVMFVNGFKQACDRMLDVIREMKVEP